MIQLGNRRGLILTWTIMVGTVCRSKLRVFGVGTTKIRLLGTFFSWVLFVYHILGRSFEISFGTVYLMFLYGLLGTIGRDIRYFGVVFVYRGSTTGVRGEVFSGQRGSCRHHNATLSFSIFILGRCDFPFPV